MSEEVLTEPLQLPGFWRRFIAFMLDGLVLGLIGMGLGFFLADQFVAWGAWGRFFGFSIAAVYFGTLNSRLGNGQTVGKRLLRLQVVGLDGALLSLPRALLRFLPLSLCWFLNNLPLLPNDLPLIATSALAILVFGVGLCLPYLLIFNRPSRQSLHDLLVGSCVRNLDEPLPQAWPPVRRLHLAVCGVFLLTAGLAPLLMRPLVSSAPFADLLKIQQAVSAEPWASHVQVYVGEVRSMSTQNGSQVTKSLQLTVMVKDGDIENTGRAQKLARLALAADASMASRDVVRITFTRGYDIGIASFWRSQTFAHSPAEWLVLP